MKKEFFLLVFVFFVISIANAANIGASLTIPQENNTTLIINYSPASPYVNQQVKFIADYEDENGTDITNASVNLTIGGITYQMTYSSSDSAYVFTKSFQSTGSYFFTVKAKKTGYKLAEESSSITIIKKEKRITKSTTGGIRPGIKINLGNESTMHPPVFPGENISISLTGDFYRIIIIPETKILYGQINLTNCNNTQVNGVFYRCISLNVNVSPYQYKQINLHFKVSKSWIKTRNINSSKIHILEISGDNTSKELNVTRTSEDNDYYYFVTKTNNLSKFVIYGEKNNAVCGDGVCSPNENCSNCNIDCGNCTNITQESNCILINAKLLDVCWYWWIILVIPFILYYLYSEEKIVSKEKRKAKRMINNLQKKLDELRAKEKQLKKSLKKTKKKNPKKLKELQEVNQKIEDVIDEITNIEHKYNINPEKKK
jgi:hypothetical protein